MSCKTVSELREDAKKQGIKGYSKMSRDALIEILKIQYPTEFLDLETKGICSYISLQKLGKPGKEGIVYLVTKDGKTSYAMKTFKKTKSPNTLRTEAYFQYMAAKQGISPKVYEYNLEEKYIIMELLEKTLIDVLKLQNYKLTEDQQIQILELYASLDKIHIVMNDPNPLNIMVKNNKFYMIDFGLAKMDTHPEFVMYTHPNYELMSFGLLDWVKNKIPTKSWKLIRAAVPKKIYDDYKIGDWM